jgi:hypothetical protein
MELPRRAKEDRFTPPGRYGELESQIRRHVRGHAVPILLMYAFDMRTRIGPYVLTDKVLVPGALPTVAAALYAAGLTNVRAVMPLWNPNLRPSQARIDGRPPEMLLIAGAVGVSPQPHQTNPIGVVSEYPPVFSHGMTRATERELRPGCRLASARRVESRGVWRFPSRRLSWSWAL